jgi:RNA 3'-terminal phosphate cyclase (ATP)
VRVAGEVRAWIDAGVPVGEHLAEQLVLPMALGRGGAFRTVAPTEHLRTHVNLLRRFLERRIDLREEGGAWRVEVAG